MSELDMTPPWLARCLAVALAVMAAQVLPPAAGVSAAQEIAATLRRDRAAYDAERERLFHFLRRAGTEAEARAMEFEIWLLWLQAPDEESARLMNGALERRRQYDLSGALALLDQLVEGAPDWAEAWNQRATVLFEMGRDSDSLEAIERVLSLEPKHFGAMAGQAMLLMRQGRFRTAQAVLRRAVGIHPFLAERSMIVSQPGERAPQPDDKRL